MEQKANESLHENIRGATKLPASGLANVDSGKVAETSETPANAGQDGEPQPIPLSDTGNQVDDADAMAVDKVGSFYVFSYSPLISRLFS